MTHLIPHRRPRYDEGCAAASALGQIGDRWALLVVRELMFTAKRFQAIRAGLPGITASVLSARLDDLEASGVVDHNHDLGLYALTEAGRALRPVLHELGRWGAGRPGHDPRRFLSPTALMLSLSVMVDPEVARHTPTLLGFEVDKERFSVHFDDDGLPVVTPVRSADGDAVLIGPGNAIGAALYSPFDLDDLVASRAIRLQGDPDAARRFIAAFRTLPAPGD